MSWLSRFTNVFRRRIEEDIEDEQRFHLDARIAELMRAGHTRESAEGLAALDFWSIALPMASLLAASLLAALPPASRAARVDPMKAIRSE